MKIFKNNNAITLMSLVITIIILIILASVGTYSGIQIVNSSKLTAFTTELKIMQTKVNELYDKKEYTIGKDISTVQTQADKVFTSSESGITNREGYRYYDKETIESLNIEGVENTFFVNVKKRSVVSYEGLKYDGNTYYTLKQLPDNLYNVEYNSNQTSNVPTFDVSVELLKRNEWKLAVNNINYDGNIKNWYLEYKLDGEENFKESKDLNVRLYEEGTYKVKVANGDFESEEQPVELYTPDNNYVKNHVEDYYGHYVTNYNSPNDAGIADEQGQLGKWQIFMADDDNIYLIASNYITRKYTGTKNGVGYNYNTSNYTEATATKMWFTDIRNQYNANSTTTDIPELLSKFDNKTVTEYHKWMNIPENQIKNYHNEKSIESIIDVDIWSGYKNTKYAKYAIGGPTIEMFCKSYNETRIEGTALLTIDANGDSGYTIRKGNQNPPVLQLKTGANNTVVDNMYFKQNTQGDSYWFASPRDISGNYYIMHTGCSDNGRINANAYNNDAIGFRPLVCLKSDMCLLKNADGETYSIIKL